MRRQPVVRPMTEVSKPAPRPMRLMWIIWPAFLLAGVQEMVVFALVDPQDLSWGGAPLPLSRTGIYSVTFLVFWLLMMVATALTVLLSRSAFEINHPDDVASSAGDAAAPPRSHKAE